MALVVVDVQDGFDDPAWGRRDNPECERNVARLLAAWRERGRPVVLVTLDRTAPGGTVLTAEELARATAADLHGESATVVTTDQLLDH